MTLNTEKMRIHKPHWLEHGLMIAKWVPSAPSAEISGLRAAIAVGAVLVTLTIMCLAPVQGVDPSVAVAASVTVV